MGGILKKYQENHLNIGLEAKNRQKNGAWRVKEVCQNILNISNISANISDISPIYPIYHWYIWEIS